MVDVHPNATEVPDRVARAATDLGPFVTLAPGSRRFGAFGWYAGFSIPLWALAWYAATPGHGERVLAVVGTLAALVAGYLVVRAVLALAVGRVPAAPP